MKSITLALLFTALVCAEEYKLGPDSQPQPGVPKGAVTKHTWTSKIFPGTVRDYWVYAPAQYKGDKPAAVMIFQDGGGFVGEKSAWQAPTVLDNLIHRGQMPVTIGIFINPGVLPALSPDAQARYNRSFEYDALGDRYARFLIEEILPEVGKSYKLSSDPNDVGLAGSSSGGIAAFNAAWNRPDAFRRVLSCVGSYTNLRGGHDFPWLIRKTEPKPLRVLLQDGSKDQDIYSGSWYIANQDVAAALAYSGYDHKFVVGTEGHNAKHCSAILPDSLRWLWRDYPRPIEKSTLVRDRGVGTIVDLAKGWEKVSEGHKFTEGPAVDKQGNVFFSDIPNNAIHRLGVDGKVTVFKDDTGGVNGLMLGPDGRLYGCQNRRKRIVAYSMDGSEVVIAAGVGSNDLAVTKKGEVYFSDPADRRVWFVDAKGAKRVVVEKEQEFPNGVRLSPDHSLLMVADYRGKWVWSYQVQPDGSLANGQALFRLEAPDESSFSGADGMAVDSEGWLYVATRMGVQICDPAGRVNAILEKPQPGALSNAVFGGPGFDWLYVTAGDKVFRRRMLRKGVLPGVATKPPQPRM